MTATANAVHNAVRSAAGLMLGFAVSVLVARALGPDLYGSYTYLTWLTSVLTAILGLGLPTAITKMVSGLRGAGTGVVGGVLDAALRVAGITGTLVVAAILVLAVAVPLPVAPIHLTLAVVTVVPSVLAACYGAAINGLQQYRPTVGVSVVVMVIQFGLTVLALTLGAGVTTLLFISLVGAVASLVWLRVMARRLLGPDTTAAGPEERIRLRRYARDVVGIVLLDAIVWKRSEVFFLERFWDIRTVGFYSLAFGIAEKAMRVPHALYGPLFPAFSSLAAARNMAAVQELLGAGTRLVGLVVLPVGLTLAALADPFVRIVYGPAYAPAAGVLAALILVNVLGAATGVAVMTLYGIGVQRLVLRRECIAAAVNLAINLTITPAWGIFGAVMANCAAQVVATAITWWYVAQRFSVRPLLDGFLRVLAASTLAAGAARVVVGTVRGGPGLSAALVVAVAVYAVAVLCIGGLRSQDRRLLGLGTT